MITLNFLSDNRWKGEMLNFVSSRHNKKEVSPGEEERQQNVAMTISPHDFPGDESIAEEIIPVLYEIYHDDATMAYMTFARGSVLMQDAQFFTTDLLIGALDNAPTRK